MTKVKNENETIMIEWNDCLFSENIYAYFEDGMSAVFSNCIDDLCMPEDRVIQPHESGAYEVFGLDDETGEYLYTGRLFISKNAAPLV